MSPGNPGQAEALERLVADLGAAFQQRSVYSANHPQVKAALARILGAFEAWCARAGTAEVSLICLEGQLLVDRQAAPEDAPWARGLLKAFRRHGIRGLTMVAGLDAVELGLFLDSCHGPKGPAPSRHILVGQAGFAAEEAPVAAGRPGSGPAQAGPGALSAEQLEGARSDLAGVASGAVTRVDRLRSLVSWLARAADPGALESLRVAAARINDAEFLHGVAVALTTMRLARALRVEDGVVENLALSGLLHDVGYVEVRDPFEDSAQRRTVHPVRGAARLAMLEAIPDVTVLVAYEHHLRFDGAASYPAITGPRRPVAAARVVAVADTWETLRSYGQVEPAEALALLRGRSGTFLDPALVAIFAELLRR